MLWVSMKYLLNASFYVCSSVSPPVVSRILNSLLWRETDARPWCSVGETETRFWLQSAFIHNHTHNSQVCRQIRMPGIQSDLRAGNVAFLKNVLEHRLHPTMHCDQIDLLCDAWAWSISDANPKRSVKIIACNKEHFKKVTCNIVSTSSSLCIFN